MSSPTGANPLAAGDVAIISLSGDLHALTVSAMLNENYNIRCHVVESNRIAGHAGLAWSNASDGMITATLPTTAGETIEVEELALIWARRIGFPQDLPENELQDVEIGIIDTNCRAALRGILASSFSGTLIDNPAAIHRAENKLLQLKVAAQAGLRVPRTLVSQDPREIRDFCAGFGSRTIVKAVKVSGQHPLLTLEVSEEMLACDEALRSAPAMYQELIPGVTHLRVNCFGEETVAFAIDSHLLDWRADLTVPVRRVGIAASLDRKLRAVLDLFALKMGVFDLKCGDNGDVVWLELNPQGQFLFLEGITGEPLRRLFADFLVRELAASRSC